MTAVGAQGATDNTKTWDSNAYYAHATKITNGPAGGRMVIITGNTTGGVFTIGGSNGDQNWTLAGLAPEVGNTCLIYPVGPVLGSSGKNYIEWTAEASNGGFFQLNMTQLGYPGADAGFIHVGSTGGAATGVLVEYVDLNAVTASMGNNFNGFRIEKADSCTFRYNWIDGIKQTENSAHNAAAFMTYSARACSIYGNEITNCGSALYPKGESSQTQHTLYFYLNKVKACTVGFRSSYTTADTDAGVRTTQKNKLYQNLFITCPDGVNWAEGTQNWDIYNNTINAGAQCQSTYTQTDVLYMTRRNNIVSNCTYAGYNMEDVAAVVGTSNYNCIYNNTRIARLNSVSYTVLSVWRLASGWDADSITSNPNFVDAANDDFHISGGALTAGDTGGPVGAYITGSETIGVSGWSEYVAPVVPAANGEFPAVFARRRGRRAR